MANLTPDIDDKQQQDEAYSPTSRTARELHEAEQRQAFDDDFNPERMKQDGKSGDLSGGALEKEKDPDASWKNNVGSNYGSKQTPGGKILSGANVRAILKKRGPLGLIAIIGLGGGLAGTLLFSPGILLVQMKESLVDRFNTQLGSADARSTKLLNSKIAATTNGICGSRITIKCKFATISDKQAARFKLAGIDIDGTPTKFGNRVKPASYTFNGTTMSAQEFVSNLKTDPNLRAATRKAYNPKFAGFADKIWGRVSNKIGVSKARPLPDGDIAVKDAAINESTKSGKTIPIPTDGITCGDKGCFKADGTEIPQAEADKIKAERAAVAQAADEASDSTEKATEKTIAATSGVSAVTNIIKLTGYADTACQAYSAVRGLGFAAKTVRAIQLARYAMIFVNTADQIKAGTAKPEDVAYLGGILTNISHDVTSGIKRKAAMDSAGMQYALYGTSGGFNAPSQYISQFMAGGGLAGDLIVLTDYINAVLGKSPAGTCNFLANGWVQLASTVGGIALMFVPGVDVVLTAKDIIGGIAQAAVSIALALLPSMLQDIVAGNVVKGIVGEDAGNAIASGFGVIASQTAQAGGNAPMSIDDAVAYTNLQNQTVAMYNNDERATLSPLDASNKNTFLGSIVNKLLPYADNVSSISGSIRSVGSIVSSSFAGIIPKSSALDTANQTAAFKSCNDSDIQTLQIASDPFCNPIFGIPPKYLDRDPSAVADALAGQYDEETGEPIPGSNYAKYVTNCISRDIPLGSGGDDGSGSTDGSECKINDQNANADFYLFYIDQRTDASMDGYSTEDIPVAATSKQSIAAKIVAKNNITYLGDVKPSIQAIADGADANAEPCGINMNILKIIDTITDKYSIKISDINRHCTNSTANGQSSTRSRHYAGNGSAIDIAVINGVATTGRDANAIAVINMVMPILLQAGVSANSYSQIGQFNCGTNVNIADPLHVHVIRDSCNHLHLDVPAVSDTSLKYTPGGW